MFVLIAHYSQVPELVAPHIPAHRDWVKQYVETGVIVAAGPKRNGLGGVCLMRSMPREELQKILEQDSYVQANVVEYQVIELDFTVASAAFEALKTL